MQHFAIHFIHTYANRKVWLESANDFFFGSRSKRIVRLHKLRLAILRMKTSRFIKWGKVAVYNLHSLLTEETAPFPLMNFSVTMEKIFGFKPINNSATVCRRNGNVFLGQLDVHEMALNYFCIIWHSALIVSCTNNKDIDTYKKLKWRKLGDRNKHTNWQRTNFDFLKSMALQAFESLRSMLYLFSFDIWPGGF